MGGELSFEMLDDIWRPLFIANDGLQMALLGPASIVILRDGELIGFEPVSHGRARLIHA